METLLSHLPVMDQKLDTLVSGQGNLDGRMEAMEGRLASVETSPARPDKGFVMGVAAVGGLLFEFAIRVVGPVAKPLLATMGFIVR